MALCDCPADVTGASMVSLDLLAEWDIEVRASTARHRMTAPRTNRGRSMSKPSDKRIDYAGSVHGEEEIAAVVDVLSGSSTAMRIGKNVRRLEQLVAATFDKRRGIMVNSGSSALYLAIELLRPQPGDEIITSPVTFSTDISPMARAGVTPVFVDVTPDTYQLDTDRLEEAVTDRTTAILVPNLIGNCPDWDDPRRGRPPRPRRHRGCSCDCMGATLRGMPTGARADMSLTSFALSHIITAAAPAVRFVSTTTSGSTGHSSCAVGVASEVALWGSKTGRPGRGGAELGNVEPGF